MKFHYDLTGAEPIVRDVPVYDAATLARGELVMLDPAAATDCQFITAYTGANTEAVDAIGVMQETLTTTSKANPGDAVTTAGTVDPPQDAISSIAAGVAAGSRYGKVIINPFAVYLAEYSQAAADDVAFTQAWNSTTLTCTSLEDNIDGGYVFVSAASANASAKGQLRYLTASAAGSATTDSAPAVATTTNDTFIKVLPANHRLTALSADGIKLKSQAAAGSGVSLTILENYIGGSEQALEPLRAQRHKGGNFTSHAKLFADVLLTDHIYNPA